MDQAYEEKRLASVRAFMLEQINALTGLLPRRRKGVEESRDVMWAETHVIRDFDDVAYLASMESDVAFYERQYTDASRRLNNLMRMLDSPYFGRIDFVEDGYGDREEIYIGIHSLFDERTLTYYVYDWRAPISSLYYDYGVGRASFAAPDGEVGGEILLKRQYKIDKGRLQFLFDSDLKIDDDILQMELSRASDAKVKTIINTIQQEQNRAIRCDADNVVVFGPAGSGKTSVGLHRLAYLLYRHRGSLTSARVRIFSSNTLFSSYIAGIIPELGEEDVVTTDFKTLLTDMGGTRAFHDMYEQIDSLYGTARTENADVRGSCVAMKYSEQFVGFAEDYIRRYTPKITEDLQFNGELVAEATRIADLYRDRTTVGNMASKTARALDYANRCYDEYFKENKKAIKDYFDEQRGENFNESEVESQFDGIRNAALGELRNKLFPDATRLYGWIVRAYVQQHKQDMELYRFTSDALRGDGALWFEDALMLFFIDTVTGKIKKDRSVLHILADEAQDMNYLQHRILRNLFDGCHFTVLADTNQALYPALNITDRDKLLSLYGGATLIQLTKSYRSTYEISRFAAQLIGTFDESAVFRREGGEPEVITTNDPVTAAITVLDTLTDSFNTVGILLSDASRAAAFHQQLSAATTAKPVHITNADGDFSPGVMVMAAACAKGLEFDAVILPEYGEAVFDGEQGRRVLYLLCTRALHKLFLIKSEDAIT